MCVHERQDNGSGTVKIQGEEVAKVVDFNSKYWRVRKRSEEESIRILGEGC